MDNYINIQLKPDAKKPINWLLNEIYTKLHKALCDLSATDIGVSFPKVGVTLGGVLRLHSTEQRLKQLMQLNWLGGMSGYCEVSEVLGVPDNCQYRTLGRLKPAMSQSKLNRLIKRGTIQPQQVKDYRAKMFSKGLDNPYLEIQSGSNGQRYRRYIQFGELRDASVSGAFDQFGLSKIATVPWF